MIYFSLNEKPNLKGFYLLQFDCFKANYTSSGSYNVLPARLLHMSYNGWLEFCKDLGARVNRTKNAKYAAVYFPDNSNVRKLITILNRQMKLSLDYTKGE